MEKELIEIDGSYGSGGGQIIRTALALSAVTGKACHITNIRAKRENPGLSYQHLTAIKAVAKLCEAKVKGAVLRSKELTFIPGKIKSGTFNFDIGTAGSITLVLQALLPAALCASSTIKFNIIGGTNVPFAPSSEYFQYVLSYFLSRMGIEIQASLLKYGFYPAGGGKMHVTIKPCEKVKTLELTERGKLIEINCCSIASQNLKQARVAERQIKGFCQNFYEEPKMKINKKIIYADSVSVGSAFHSHANYENCKLGADSLGKKGIPAENVGENCANLLKEEIEGKGCVDKHMVDQLLPFIALAGKGKILANEITDHARTNAFVIEKFLPVKFEINEKEAIIKCRNNI